MTDFHDEFEWEIEKECIELQIAIAKLLNGGEE